MLTELEVTHFDFKAYSVYVRWELDHEECRRDLTAQEWKGRLKPPAGTGLSIFAVTTDQPKSTSFFLLRKLPSTRAELASIFL